MTQLSFSRSWLTVLALLTCAVSLVSNAEQTQDSFPLYVQDLVVRPDAQPPLPESLLAVAQTDYALVQYEVESGQQAYDAIVQAGGTIYGPVAEHGLLVGALDLTVLRKISGVSHVMAYHPGFKLAPSLRKEVEAKSERFLNLVVTLFEESRDTGLEALELGARVQLVRNADNNRHLLVSLPASQLPQLAASRHVRQIEPASLPLAELDVAPRRINVRANAAPPWTNRWGLDGNGQLLGIYDTGVDTGDTDTLIADLRGRVHGDVDNWINQTMHPTWAGLNYAGDPSGHGTMVTDTAIGNGATSDHGLLTGVGFKADVLIRPFNADVTGLQPGYLNVGEALDNAFAAGARVHNNSWVPATGTFPNLQPILNTYSEQGSAVIDQFVRTNPTMLILTSAGNYGGQGANSIGTLSVSKNSLSVGNSGNGNPPTGAALGGHYSGVATNEIALSSSIGPVPGARLKPEVNAPGAMVAMRCPQSTQATCANISPYQGQPDFKYASGTSFSTPLVSGTAILLRQLFARQPAQQDTDPTGMLLKAILVNGAAGIYDYAPDTRQGWGRIDLQASLESPNGQEIMFYDSLKEAGAAFQFTHAGQSVVFENIQFSVDGPVMITLTWYDPPDATYSGMLINDLDLSLTLPNGTVYFGGVNSMANGVTAPNGAADMVNNTEKIVLTGMPDGACTNAEECVITVRASTIAPEQPQPFALAVSQVSSQGTTQALVKGETNVAPGTLRELTLKPEK